MKTDSIETDKYGFNNPKDLYKEHQVDIVLTGDSFTEGYRLVAEAIEKRLKTDGFSPSN